MLEIVTRHLYSRPGLLRRNQASTARLIGGGWIQTILVDDVGRGVAWANAQMRTFEPTGDYVWLLDDDDECILPTFAADLNWLADRYRPGIVLVCMDHGPGLGILPDKSRFGQDIGEGEIGCSGFVTRSDVWMQYRHAWGERYAGDFDFFHAMQRAGVSMCYWGALASKISRRSIGSAE